MGTNRYGWFSWPRTNCRTQNCDFDLAELRRRKWLTVRLVCQRNVQNLYYLKKHGCHQLNTLLKSESNLLKAFWKPVKVGSEIWELFYWRCTFSLGGDLDFLIDRLASGESDFYWGFLRIDFWPEVTSACCCGGSCCCVWFWGSYGCFNFYSYSTLSLSCSSS